MPFIEHLDMDRFSGLARHNALDSARDTRISLLDCDSMEHAQRRLAAALWNDDGSRTALNVRCVREALRITKDADIAIDLVQDAYIAVVRQWRSVRDASAVMFRAVSNLALNVIRDHKRESMPGDIAATSDRAQQRPGRPIATLAVASLRMLAEQATETEMKIIALCCAESWDGQQAFPSFAAIAEKMDIKSIEVTRALIALGKRAGVWSSERVWRPAGAAPRRSAQWFREQIARFIQPICAWDDDGDGSGLARYWAPNNQAWDDWSVEHAGDLIAAMENDTETTIKPAALAGQAVPIGLAACNSLLDYVVQQTKGIS